MKVEWYVGERLKAFTLLIAFLVCQHNIDLLWSKGVGCDNEGPLRYWLICN